MWSMLVAAAIAACGPSSKDVQVATTAHYRASEATIFSIALEVTQETFKIATTNDLAGKLLTLPKWYSADGQSQSAGVGDGVLVNDGSLLVALLVEVGTDETGVIVKVTPITERYRMGQSQTEKLPPDDPSLPGWVTGKAEALAVAIHERAKQYAIE
jgi:hypothetical protein